MRALKIVPKAECFQRQVSQLPVQLCLGSRIRASPPPHCPRAGPAVQAPLGQLLCVQPPSRKQPGAPPGKIRGRSFALDSSGLLGNWLCAHPAVCKHLVLCCLLLLPNTGFSLLSQHWDSGASFPCFLCRPPLRPQSLSSLPAAAQQNQGAGLPSAHIGVSWLSL